MYKGGVSIFQIILGGKLSKNFEDHRQIQLYFPLIVVFSHPLILSFYIHLLCYTHDEYYFILS